MPTCPAMKHIKIGMVSPLIYDTDYLTGGYICLNLGLYGYLSDVTTSEDRTMRLSILVIGLPL